MANDSDLLPFQKLLDFIQTENVFDDFDCDEKDFWKSEEFSVLIKKAEEQLINLSKDNKK